MMRWVDIGERSPDPDQNEGPTPSSLSLRGALVCVRCKWLVKPIEGGTGHTSIQHYCTHPTAISRKKWTTRYEPEGHRWMGETGFTPVWCPFLAAKGEEPTDG
jgi:hypothetical protein